MALTQFAQGGELVMNEHSCLNMDVEGFEFWLRQSMFLQERIIAEQRSCYVGICWAEQFFFIVSYLLRCPRHQR